MSVRSFICSSVFCYIYSINLKNQLFVYDHFLFENYASRSINYEAKVQNRAKTYWSIPNHVTFFGWVTDLCRGWRILSSLAWIILLGFTNINNNHSNKINLWSVRNIVWFGANVLAKLTMCIGTHSHGAKQRIFTFEPYNNVGLLGVLFD